MGNELNKVIKLRKKFILGNNSWPWLFSIVQIFDRWEICRFFNKFDNVKFKFHFVKDYKINYLFSRPYYRSAQMDDY